MNERRTRRPHKQVRWSRGEEQKLEKMFHAGCPWKEIAENIGRSYGAIRHRAYKMGLRRFMDGNTEIENPTAKTISNRRYIKKYPEKRAAHRAVWREIDEGRLTPEPCCLCGESPSQAHHEDYSKPLDIVWLCAKCHVAEHKSARASDRAGF